MDFHEYICKKSESERLLKMWRSLRAQIQLLFYQRFLAFDWVPDTVDSDHAAILKALRQGDVQQVLEVHKEINTRVAQECVQMVHLGTEPEGR